MAFEHRTRRKEKEQGSLDYGKTIRIELKGN